MLKLPITLYNSVPGKQTSLAGTVAGILVAIVVVVVVVFIFISRRRFVLCNDRVNSNLLNMHDYIFLCVLYRVFT